MGNHGDQSVAEIYAGIAATERASGGERRGLAPLATQGGLPQDRPARERFRQRHLTTIKTLETDVQVMEAELRVRGH
jgi:hypothetical protein